MKRSIEMHDLLHISLIFHIISIEIFVIYEYYVSISNFYN